MKAGLLAIVALSAAVSAQPHRRHQQLHEQRDVVVETAYQTQVEYATVTAPAAIVYVDENGNPINEAAPTPTPAPEPTPAPAPTPETKPAAPAVNVNAAVDRAHGEGRPQGGDWGNHASSAAPASAPSTEAAPPVQAPTSEAAPAPTPTEAVSPPSAPASSQPAYSAPAESSPPPSTGGNGLGITYSPYNADGTCKTTDQVKTDIDAIQSGYSLIRLYGTDCNQVSNVLAAAKPKGYKLFLGLFDITADKIPGQVAAIASAVNGDWSSIDTVSVGNEGVNNNQYSVADVGAAVVAVKVALGVAGYHGPVVTVDTFTAIINNPGLCNVGDYVAANCHAFFDGGVTADQAGSFVIDQVQRVSAACGGKKTVITESGWPSQGDANQKAVPSKENQAAAVASLQKSFSNNLILFNAYDDSWKKDTAATFNAEKHWGIYGNHPSAY